MSSDILSREVNGADFGMIYAGAQKNLGPSGMAVVILRKDLAERCPETVGHYFRYRTHMPEPSLYNTPNTWAIYIFKLVTEWMLDAGGVPAMRKVNDEKAAVLYDALDASAFWKPCAEKKYRSMMNVTWRMATEELEKKFASERVEVVLIPGEIKKDFSLWQFIKQASGHSLLLHSPHTLQSDSDFIARRFT